MTSLYPKGSVKPRIVGVNGIWSHGEENIDLLLYELNKLGYPIIDVFNDNSGPFRARFSAKKDAKEVIRVSQDGDILIAHSYGCLKAAYAMQQIKYAQVYMFRPAMSRKWKAPQGTITTCIYSKNDLAILVGSWLLFHPFGAAGRKGFDDSNILNIQSTGGHSEDFANSPMWAKYIDGRLNDHR